MKKFNKLFLVFLCLMIIQIINVQGKSATYQAKKKAPIYQKYPAKKKTKILKYIPKKTKVTIKYINKTYGKVTYKKKTGYVKFSYFKKIATSKKTTQTTSKTTTQTTTQTTSQETDETTYKKGVYVLKSDVVVRKTADRSGEEVVTLNKGTTISLTQFSQSWGIFSYQYEDVYIPMANLSYQSSPASTTYKAPNHTVKVIAIDPGHQKKGDLTYEPIGPFADYPQKYKNTVGCSGYATRQLESALNLDIANKLKALLEERGYQVVMVRTSQSDKICNSERAAIANHSQADAYVRIHADSSEDHRVYGFTTYAPAGTSGNTYQVGQLQKASVKLSECILKEALKTTGAKSLGLLKRDWYAGSNYSKVPVTMIEMGFLSNAEEDRKLATEAYRDQVALGIANGVDAYFAS